MLHEIRALGATDVEIVVQWVQPSLDAPTIAPRAGASPSMETLRRTLRQAHREGLRVLLFPIVRLETGRADEWRGRIRYIDPERADAWWSSYGAFVGELAKVASDEGVERFSVGSELLALEGDRPHWQRLVADVRRNFSGRLLYSANWDHFDAVELWDLVDEVGVTGYFELTRSRTPSTAALEAAWRGRLDELHALAARVGKPLVMTEVGYPALDGANTRPWNETFDAELDIDEQRQCYQAFSDASVGATFLRGVYFWNWFGVGGPNDTGYSPRGKPAALVIERHFTRR
jgi:hypothetical protein